MIIFSGRFLNTIDHLQPTYIGQKTGLGSSCGLKAGILLSRPLLVKVMMMIVVKVMTVVVVKVIMMIVVKVMVMVVVKVMVMVVVKVKAMIVLKAVAGFSSTSSVTFADLFLSKK